ncbi:alpha/beta fold hydrolase [Pseudoroseomonas sp. WGS1072]|uniref:alpha/beta fold hydrolase n=1 Tax=Roseomonas sp. WGS1072 TaxID=3366816 RepID=UPI003BF131EF
MPDSLPTFRPPGPHDAGHPGPPSLLLLHGAGCGAWVWRHGFEASCAEAGLTVRAQQFDRGAAQRAGLSDYVEQTRALLRAQAGPVVLVGHSLGALVAQRLLLEPQVRGAVLLAPVPPEGLWWSSARLALADAVLWAEAARMDLPPGQAPAELAAALFSAAMPMPAARAALARMGGESSRALLEAQWPQPVPPGWLHRRPVLVLGAGQDRLIPPDAVRRCALWHGVPVEFLPGCGHVMMLEPGAEGLARRIAEWTMALRDAG